MATWGMGLAAVGAGSLTLLGATVSPPKPPMTLTFDLSRLPVGAFRRVVFDEKPIVIWHRKPEQVSDARDLDLSALRDPRANNANFVSSESAVDENRSLGDFLIVSSRCTHSLACVVVEESGDFGGYFCPCCASHYDLSGRVRKGPARRNLSVPAYAVAGNVVTFYRIEDRPMSDDQLENLLRPKSS